MYLQIYILLSHITYYTTCNFLKKYEEDKIQRKIASVRSTKNFTLSYIVSIILTTMRYHIMPTVNNEWTQDVITFILWLIMAETIFSTVHFLLHKKSLYWIHKQHHENNPSYSTSSLDCHPIEFLIANVSSIATPMYIFHGSRVLGSFWIIFATINTCYAHYKEGDHMIHHRRFRYNYGQGSYLFDKLMGTYLNKNY